MASRTLPLELAEKCFNDRAIVLLQKKEKKNRIGKEKDAKSLLMGKPGKWEAHLLKLLYEEESKKEETGTEKEEEREEERKERAEESEETALLALWQIQPRYHQLPILDQMPKSVSSHMFLRMQ